MVALIKRTEQAIISLLFSDADSHVWMMPLGRTFDKKVSLSEVGSWTDEDFIDAAKVSAADPRSVVIVLGTSITERKTKVVCAFDTSISSYQIAADWVQHYTNPADLTAEIFRLLDSLGAIA